MYVWLQPCNHTYTLYDIQGLLKDSEEVKSRLLCSSSKGRFIAISLLHGVVHAFFYCAERSFNSQGISIKRHMKDAGPSEWASSDVVYKRQAF